jgi:hypothetical protein
MVYLQNILYFINAISMDNHKVCRDISLLKMRDEMGHVVVMGSSPWLFVGATGLTGFSMHSHYTFISIKHDCWSLGSMMQFEQHVNIKFMCRLGKSASEMLSALKEVYGNTAQKKSTVYAWFSQLKNGQKVKIDRRNGRLLTCQTK